MNVCSLYLWRYLKKESIMPRFNRKGPKGEAMSGRGRGGCNPSGRGRDDLESQVEAGADAPNQSRHRRREIYRVEGDGSNASFQPGNGKDRKSVV